MPGELCQHATALLGAKLSHSPFSVNGKLDHSGYDLATTSRNSNKTRPVEPWLRLCLP